MGIVLRRFGNDDYGVGGSEFQAPGRIVHDDSIDGRAIMRMHVQFQGVPVSQSQVGVACGIVVNLRMC